MAMSEWIDSNIYERAGHRHGPDGESVFGNGFGYGNSSGACGKSGDGRGYGDYDGLGSGYGAGYGSGYGEMSDDGADK